MKNYLEKIKIDGVTHYPAINAENEDYFVSWQRFDEEKQQWVDTGAYLSQLIQNNYKLKKQGMMMMRVCKYNNEKKQRLADAYQEVFKANEKLAQLEREDDEN